MNSHIIQRLRQNAVSLMVKDQNVKQLADIVAELCLVCEDQQKQLDDLKSRLASQGAVSPEVASI